MAIRIYIRRSDMENGKSLEVKIDKIHEKIIIANEETELINYKSIEIHNDSDNLPWIKLRYEVGKNGINYIDEFIRKLYRLNSLNFSKEYVPEYIAVYYRGETGKEGNLTNNIEKIKNKESDYNKFHFLELIFQKGTDIKLIENVN